MTDLPPLKMHFAASIIALGSLAASAAAAAAPGFQFPAAVPLDKRQTSGPAYECHAHCVACLPVLPLAFPRTKVLTRDGSQGYAIQNAAKEGYCKDDAWLKDLDGCLKCAIEQDIWKYYGTKVGAAAKACGLDATPVQPGGGESQSSAAPSTSAAASTPAQQPSSSAAQPTTGAQQPSTTQSSAAPTAPSATASGSANPPTTGTVSPTASGPAASHSSNSTASASPSSVTVSGGSQVLGSSLFVGGIAALVAAAWF
ncbi:hypothetical protein O9K51_08837 [Purpureocillium lavendulum]|uniref:Uncharacterized protein n=1 Tax=Purpureocillium lavendulum TaxID=1247861 RepID=A0AB34FH43_9HYPO|nr:hypothetical protein O9K51_08837 [Purpureocillium lavendulum]